MLWSNQLEWEGRQRVALLPNWAHEVLSMVTIYLLHWIGSRPGVEFSSSCFHTMYSRPSALVAAQVRTQSSWRKEQSKSKNLIFSLLGQSTALHSLKLDTQYTKHRFNQPRALKGSSEQMIFAFQLRKEFRLLLCHHNTYILLKNLLALNFLQEGFTKTKQHLRKR